jgi:hypothetical protein
VNFHGDVDQHDTLLGFGEHHRPHATEQAALDGGALQGRTRYAHCGYLAASADRERQTDLARELWRLDLLLLVAVANRREVSPQHAAHDLRVERALDSWSS